jgi:hypothetical protein
MPRDRNENIRATRESYQIQRQTSECSPQISKMVERKFLSDPMHTTYKKSMNENSDRPASGAVPNRADKRTRIIELNDQFRTTFKGGRVQMTPGVYDLDARLRGRALSVLARYNKFDDGSEHDWGVFIFAGYSFEWCIEYRGKDGGGVSTDPADPEKTFRVLTLYAVDDLLLR